MKLNWFKRIRYRINPKHKDRLFCTIFGREKYKECIEKDILKDVLSGERSAVMLEMLTTFDEKVYEEGLREEGREEERANTERERKRADDNAAELAKYRSKYGPL